MLLIPPRYLFDAIEKTVNRLTAVFEEDLDETIVQPGFDVDRLHAAFLWM